MIPQSDFPLLIAQNGPLEGERWEIDKTFVLGRDSTCGIVIPNRQVSRYHARITPTDEGVILEDMDSKNGTYKNGEKITTPVVLQDGDTIHIAMAQQFTFLTSDATLPLDSAPRRSGRLVIEERSRRVWINQRQVAPPLSAQQFRLLWTLYEQEGEVIPRPDLIAAIWGESQAPGVSDQALDALVRRLRDRLAALDPGHQYIVTVRGHGIRLDNPPQ